MSMLVEVLEAAEAVRRGEGNARPRFYAAYYEARAAWEEASRAARDAELEAEGLSAWAFEEEMEECLRHGLPFEAVALAQLDAALRPEVGESNAWRCRGMIDRARSVEALEAIARDPAAHPEARLRALWGLKDLEASGACATASLEVIRAAMEAGEWDVAHASTETLLDCLGEKTTPAACEEDEPGKVLRLFH